VLLVPAVVNQDVRYDQAWERSRAEIQRVLPRAVERGVKIAFENVWNQFLLSPLEAARYVDSFESAAVGWYLDVGNVVNYGWPEQWVRILGKRILKLDIKEYSRKRRDAEGLWKGFDVELGEGDCGWPAVMAALDEIGYAGWGTAEIPGGGRERLSEIAARMERIFAR
jgi:hexulose-6-phosphate isomerase